MSDGPPSGGGPPGHEVTLFPMGTIYAGVGYKYDPRGEKALLEASKRIASAFEQLNTQGAVKAPAASKSTQSKIIKDAVSEATKALEAENATIEQQEENIEKLRASLVKLYAAQNNYTDALKVQEERINAAQDDELKLNKLLIERIRLLDQADAQARKAQRSFNKQTEEPGADGQPVPTRTRRGTDPAAVEDRAARVRIQAARDAGDYAKALSLVNQRLRVTEGDQIRYNRYLSLGSQILKQATRDSEQYGIAQERAARKAAKLSEQTQRELAMQLRPRILDQSGGGAMSLLNALGAMSGNVGQMSALSRVGSELIEVGAGFGLATTAAEGLVQVLHQVQDGFELQARIDQSRRALGVFYQDMKAGDQVVDQAIKFGRQYGFTQEEMAGKIGEAGRVLRRTTADMNTTLSVLLRLQAISPEQGMEGAIIALNELTGGGPDAVRSLVRRFEIPLGEAQKLRNETKNGRDAIEALDESLNRLGATSDLLDQRMQGPNGALVTFRLHAEDARLALAEWAQDHGFERFLRNISDQLGMVAQLLNGFKGQNLELNIGLFDRGNSFEQYQAALDDVIHQIDNPFIKALVKAGYYFRTLSEEEYNSAKQLINWGMSAEEAIKQVTRNSQALEDFKQSLDLSKVKAESLPNLPNRGALLRVFQEYGDGLFRVASGSDEAAKQLKAALSELEKDGDYQKFVEVFNNLDAAQRKAAASSKDRVKAAQEMLSADQKAQQAAENLANAQKELSDSVVKAGQDLQKATDDMVESLENIDDGHRAKVADLNQQIVDVQNQTQNDINAEVEKGQLERYELEQDNAQRITKLQEEQGQRRQKREAGYRREDIRLETDYQQQLADIEEQYQQQRSDILEDQARRRKKAEEDEARERLRAQERAQADQIQSYESFIDRLYDITRPRGGGGRAARAEANQRLEEARREAAELAKVDAEAAAELLKAREQQILQDLQDKADAATRRRDAKRGDVDFTEVESEEEIKAKADARKAATDAEIDLIKKTAQQRQEDREREKKEQAEDDQRSLDEVDKQHQRQVDKAKKDHDQRLAQIQQDRALERQEQAAQDAQDVAQLEAANKERLDEYDKAHQDRINQIRDQGEKKANELRAALKKEDDEYIKARQKVIDDYNKFYSDLQAELTKQANELDMTPDEKAQAELEEAYRDLADRLGSAFVDQLRQHVEAETAGTLTPVAPALTPGQGQSASTPTSQRKAAPRGGSVNVADPVLSTGAIDQVVMGGTESSSFSDLRGASLHGGVDLAVPSGTPVKSPVDGQILQVGSTKEGGNYVIVQAANGDQWYFGHLDHATVKVGDKVRRGQQIAVSDSTGTAITGPHVHVQLRKGGKVVDPTAALEAVAGSSTSGGRGGGSFGGSTTSDPPPYRVGSMSLGIGSGPGLLPGEGLTLKDLPGANLFIVNQEDPKKREDDISGINLTAILDLHGAVFGPGTDPGEIKRIADEAAHRFGEKLLKDLMRDVKHQRKQGNILQGAL